MATKPTKQQLEQARLRSRSAGIPMDTSAKGLRNAGKAIATAAALLPAGRAVKVAATAPKLIGRAVRVAQNKKSVEKTKKAVNYVADIQQKVKAEKIAKNSVKVKSAGTKQSRAEKNSAEGAKVMTSKTGARARYEAGQVEKKRQLPSKVVKINSKNK